MADRIVFEGELDLGHMTLIKALSARELYVEEIASIAEKDDRIVITGADVGAGGKIGEFKEKYPERFIDTGIAEADQVGVSKRTIASYECTDAMARRSTVVKLARALKVSVKYLTDPDCTNPLEDIEKDGHVEEARRLYGAAGVRDVEALLNENAALFAGGELSQEEKDAFFEAVMRAYFASKDEAKKKFGRKQ